MDSRSTTRARSIAAPLAMKSTTVSQVVLAVCAGWLISAAASAQTTDEDSDVIVVRSAPIEGARVESLQGADILRRDDVVANLGGGGLGATLDARPGISTTFFGAGASRPIIRGLGEDRVRVLENGIGAIDASTASPDHAVTADGLDAERIEVLRGAAALAYGGNAIGGVVNVIDQSIPTYAQDRLSFDGLVGYSSVDEGDQEQGSVAGGAGPFAFRLTGAGRDTDSYDTPIGEAFNSWTTLRTGSLGGSLVGDWGYAGVAVKRTDDDYGLLPEGEGEPGGHIELNQTREEARGDVRVDLGPFSRVDFAAQHSDYDHTEYEGDGAAGTRFESEGWEGRVEAHHRGDMLQGAVGLQLSDVDFAAFGEEGFITPTNTRNTGLFVVERWDTGDWGLEGGARVEQVKIDNMTFGKQDFDNTSASAGVFFRPATDWFVGGTVAHTERAPTEIELFADGPHLATESYERGEPTLGQEKALSFEVSTRYTTAERSFELNVFHMAFDNYIALSDSGGVWWVDEDTEMSGFADSQDDPSIPAEAEVLPVFVFAAQDATFTGGEISGRTELFEAGGFTFSGDAAMDIVQAEFDASGHPPRIPPRTLTLGVEGENERWTGRLEAVDTAEQDRLDINETPTDGFTFLNASLAFRPFGNERDLTLRLDGRNLTDELGRVHASFLKDELPLPGRNVRVTVTTSF